MSIDNINKPNDYDIYVGKLILKNKKISGIYPNTISNPFAVVINSDDELGTETYIKSVKTLNDDPVPTNDNTQGFSLGSQWINENDNILYTCIDATTNNARWYFKNITIPFPRKTLVNPIVGANLPIIDFLTENNFVYKKFTIALLASTSIVSLRIFNVTNSTVVGEVNNITGPLQVAEINITPQVFDLNTLLTLEGRRDNATGDYTVYTLRIN